MADGMLAHKPASDADIRRIHAGACCADGSMCGDDRQCSQAGELGVEGVQSSPRNPPPVEEGVPTPLPPPYFPLDIFADLPPGGGFALRREKFLWSDVEEWKPWVLDTVEKVEWANWVLPLMGGDVEWELGDSCWYRPVV